MLTQDLGNDTRLVYTMNPDADYKKIGADFGICDTDGNASPYATVAHKQYTNSNGVQMQCWELTGKTVKLLVVADHVSNVTDCTSMANALNWFHRPVFRFERYVFTGKFKHDSNFRVRDHQNRDFTMNMNNLKDMRGIYDLMAHIGVNNGKLFEPLIVRYVTAMRALKGTEVKSIGYFDLAEYLRIVQDNRADLFSDSTHMTSTGVAVQVANGGCTVRLSNVDKTTGQAILVLDGATVIDATKVRTFTPHVIISTAPLNIRDDMPFHSTRVMFHKLPLFLTPMMSKPDAWESLTGGINLLSTAIY